jgi:hypothetical protein
MRCTSSPAGSQEQQATTCISPAVLLLPTWPPLPRCCCLLHLQLHCESPLNLRVADNANHTLEVVLADVCGEVVANGIFFGGWGWAKNMKFAPPAPPPPAPEPVFKGNDIPLPQRAPLTRNRTSAAAAVQPMSLSFSSSLVAALLGALGLVLLL